MYSNNIAYCYKVIVSGGFAFRFPIVILLLSELLAMWRTFCNVMGLAIGSILLGLFHGLFLPSLAGIDVVWEPTIVQRVPNAIMYIVLVCAMLFIFLETVSARPSWYVPLILISLNLAVVPMWKYEDFRPFLPMVLCATGGVMWAIVKLITRSTSDKAKFSVIR